MSEFKLVRRERRRLRDLYQRAPPKLNFDYKDDRHKDTVTRAAVVFFHLRSQPLAKLVISYLNRDHLLESSAEWLLHTSVNTDLPTFMFMTPKIVIYRLRQSTVLTICTPIATAPKCLSQPFLSRPVDHSPRPNSTCTKLDIREQDLDVECHTRHSRRHTKHDRPRKNHNSKPSVRDRAPKHFIEGRDHGPQDLQEHDDFQKTFPRGYDDRDNYRDYDHRRWDYDQYEDYRSGYDSDWY